MKNPGLFYISTVLALVTALLAPAVRGESTLERIERALSPHMASDDPLGLPMKVRAIRDNAYQFWRGTKDLYFNWWCKTNCHDWLADEGAYVVTHGDLHIGNIGSYASNEGFGTLGFGMVDFDDSARLPFQMELLQGVITLRLVAAENGIALSSQQQRELVETLLHRYRLAANAQGNAGRLLAGDAAVSKLLHSSEDYTKGMAKFVDGSRFRTVATSSKGKLTDLLEPLDVSRHDALATAIAEAAGHDDRLARLLATSDVTQLRSRLRGAARRTRIDSSGSQGLAKWLVWIGPPASGGQELMLYLKQQIPSAAERSGIIERDSRPPGQRCAAYADALTDPPLLANSWCTFDGRSFWVNVREPWSDELGIGNLRTFEALLTAAAEWAAVAGAAHRQGDVDRIFARLDATLADQLLERSAAYVARQADWFETLRHDSRADALAAIANAAIEQAKAKRIVP